MNATESDRIVTRILGGEIDAYEVLIRAYQQEVWKVVAAMLWNTQRTEDLVAQTFINAFQHLDTFERGRDFGLWIKEIARNQVRQEIRRSTREDRRLEVYQQELLRSYETPLATSANDPVEAALADCTRKWAKPKATSCPTICSTTSSRR